MEDRIHDRGELKLTTERCQCRGRSYSKWEALPKPGCVISKVSTKMSFGIMIPRIKGGTSYNFLWPQHVWY